MYDTSVTRPEKVGLEWQARRIEDREAGARARAHCEAAVVELVECRIHTAVDTTLVRPLLAKRHAATVGAMVHGKVLPADRRAGTPMDALVLDAARGEED